MSYYGDGDSKSYDEVKYIYPGTIVQKFECIGHCQKRVGNRLRKLRIRTKRLGGKNRKVQTKDKGKGKVTKAKGRLTDSVIDKLQNYFGIALRSNVGDLQKMQDAILACLFHVASSENDNFRVYCPKTYDSWCQYQRDAINNTNLYTPGAGISNNVIAAIKPVYADLTKPDILQKCLHGLPQNPNESFNSTIWERVQKTVYCGLDTLELAVFDAVANYNYGRKATLDIFEGLNIIAGVYATTMCNMVNKWRKYNASLHNKPSVKKRRKVLCGEKKKKSDKHFLTEVKSYEAGGF